MTPIRESDYCCACFGTVPVYSFLCSLSSRCVVFNPAICFQFYPFLFVFCLFWVTTLVISLFLVWMLSHVFILVVSFFSPLFLVVCEPVCSVAFLDLPWPLLPFIVLVSLGSACYKPHCYYYWFISCAFSIKFFSFSPLFLCEYPPVWNPMFFLFFNFLSSCMHHLIFSCLPSMTKMKTNSTDLMWLIALRFETPCAVSVFPFLF